LACRALADVAATSATSETASAAAIWERIRPFLSSGVGRCNAARSSLLMPNGRVPDRSS
jgi:hypothetical protein